MENEELVTLKTIYDELWSDARIMIKDLNKTITSIFLFGVVLVCMAPINLSTVIDMYSKIAGGSTSALNYFYLVTISLGVLVSLVAGVMMLRYYFQLRNRYANVIELEKTLGD